MVLYHNWTIGFGWFTWLLYIYKCIFQNLFLMPLKLKGIVSQPNPLKSYLPEYTTTSPSAGHVHATFLPSICYYVQRDVYFLDCTR
jgi:hypothetical protein